MCRILASGCTMFGPPSPQSLQSFASVFLHVCLSPLKKKKKLSGGLSRPIFTSSTQVHRFVNTDVSARLCTSLPKHAGSSQVSSRHTHTHTHCLLVPGGAPGFEYRPNQLCKNNLFLPQGYTRNRPLFNHNYLN